MNSIVSQRRVLYATSLARLHNLSFLNFDPIAPDSKIYTILIISTFQFLDVVGKKSFCANTILQPDYPVI